MGKRWRATVISWTTVNLIKTRIKVPSKSIGLEWIDSIRQSTDGMRRKKRERNCAARLTAPQIAIRTFSFARSSLPRQFFFSLTYFFNYKEHNYRNVILSNDDTQVEARVDVKDTQQFSTRREEKTSPSERTIEWESTAERHFEFRFFRICNKPSDDDDGNEIVGFFICFIMKMRQVGRRRTSELSPSFFWVLSTSSTRSHTSLARQMQHIFAIK